jgi:GNAT superfamily N-acetyltransferase
MRTVRRANLADADALGSVEVRAWQAVHRGDLDDDWLDALDPVASAEAWREQLRDPGGDRELYVVIDAGAVVGFAAIGRSRDPGATPATGEIQALVLTPEAWGRGLATDLLGSVLERLEARGFSAVTTWVPERNERARHFYAERGWYEDGERAVGDHDGQEVVRVRTRRPLG